MAFLWLGCASLLLTLHTNKLLLLFNLLPFGSYDNGNDDNDGDDGDDAGDDEVMTDYF